MHATANDLEAEIDLHMYELSRCCEDDVSEAIRQMFPMTSGKYQIVATEANS
jgi:hypothetical protein